MKRTKVGIIGCGMISDTYFQASQKFPILDVVACSDIIPERSKKKEELYGVKAVTNEDIYNNPEIEIVINLTPPQVHNKIGMESLQAGKNFYSEKPFGVDLDEATQVYELGKKTGLRVGTAPDTFLGAGQQTARKILDDGWIGTPMTGTAIVMGRGPEKWGQAPFFYDYGAGPMLDLGPYYMTALVNLLGPAKAVTAVTKKFYEYRTLGAEVSETYKDKYKPYDRYPVTIPTHLTGIIEFWNGALITVITSFDVYANGHSPIEIYGTEGSMKVPDPNTFGGPVQIFRPGYDGWKDIPLSHIYSENSRSIGAAEMAYSMQVGRPHRVNSDLAYHVLEIMLSFQKSSDLGARVELKSKCERPAPLPLGLEPGQVELNQQM